MLLPDLQRIQHIRDYCAEIEKTVQRYGKSFAIFDADADYQRSVSFCILHQKGTKKMYPAKSLILSGFFATQMRFFKVSNS